MNKASFGITAEGASITILCLWLSLSYYYFDIGDFSLPVTYMFILI